MGNFRIRKAEFLNQNSLLGRISTKIFFAPEAKIVFQQYRSIASIEHVGGKSAIPPDSGHAMNKLARQRRAVSDCRLSMREVSVSQGLHALPTDPRGDDG